MSKKSLIPPGEISFTFMFPQGIIISVTVSLGWPYARSIESIFRQMPWRNLQKIVLTGDFCINSFVIRWIVRICDVVDRFFRKLFWFFLRIFSISGLIQLRSRTLKPFCRFRSKSYVSAVLGNFDVTFLENGWMLFFSISQLYFVCLRRCTIEVTRFMFLGVIRRGRQFFCF